MEIVNALPITHSANFERKIKKLLPNNIDKVYLDTCGMERVNGYGSYNYFLTLVIDGDYFKLTSHTNSSPAWDAYQDLEIGTRKFENWVKGITLWLIEEQLYEYELSLKLNYLGT